MSFLRRSLPSFGRSLVFHSRPSSSNPFFSGVLSGGGRWPGKEPILRRSYFSDRGADLQHFRRRGAARWYRNPRAMLVVAVVAGGGAVSIYYGNLETVPYTKRSHLVLVSGDLERQLGVHQFEQFKVSIHGKILPSMHPDSVRVRLISRDIIQALQRGLRHGERRWSDLEYAPAGAGVALPSPPRPIAALRGEDGEDGRRSREEEEILDDGWVHECRKKASKAKSISEPSTGHLEGLKWEVIVVRDDAVNAFCLPGGKIVVFTGILSSFRSDAEIATVIGHEVGHAIARHGAEMITKNLWMAVLQLLLLQFFFMPDLINAMSTLLLRLPFSRRMEMEADYIGLLLMASAGYNPRVAPSVYERLGKISKDSKLSDYLSTHPSSAKRAELLSRAHVMNEALALYSEAISGRPIAGFL